MSEEYSMKIIVENSTNLVKYLLNDSDEVTMESNRIVLSDNVICDLNSNNATLIENVENKEDFSGNKYTYSDGTWTLNPDWEDPAVLIAAEKQRVLDSL